MKTTASKKLFEAALRVFPGGVNSPVRSFKAVGTLPHFIARARGAKLYDADGNAFVDYVMSWGPLILGHAPVPVVKALVRAAARGTSYGATTLGIPDSPGVPADLARHTFTAPYNDITAVERLLEAHRGNFACVIVEPVAGNMGVVPPHPDFLNRLRDLTHHYRIVLVFDEVLTGFRVAYGGAQARYGVTPDLTCLGKIIGGGLPVGAYGGRADLMKLIAPEGPVYQAGTLSGNPLAVTAGIETLKLLKKAGVYRQLEERGRQFGAGPSRAARRAGVQGTLNRGGSMMTLFFTPGPGTDYASAKKSDTQAYAKFFRAMLSQGIYLAPSQFEAVFLSTAHTPADLNKTLKAARAAFNKLKIS